MNEKQLIEQTFPNLNQSNFNMKSFANRVIVAATNNNVDVINNIATDMLHGDPFEIFSSDKFLLKLYESNRNLSN